MKWILIIFLTSGLMPGERVAATSIEFNTELSCEIAATAAALRGARDAFCVGKGYEP